MLAALSSAAVGCGDPGTPTNGQRSLSSTTYNSVVTYTCDVGYTLQGSNSRTCQSNGQWTESIPQCLCEYSVIRVVFCCTLYAPFHNYASYVFLPTTAINCGDPGTPTNGQRNVSSTTYNSVVTYTCDEGYTLQGSNTRTCQSNGQWTESIPQCLCE